MASAPKPAEALRCGSAPRTETLVEMQCAASESLVHQGEFPDRSTFIESGYG